ncbi:hypothetical protein D3C84_426740 [compost metagenome]
MVGIITKIQLFEFDHQATHVHAAEALTFTQYPVVPQQLGDQGRALNRKVAFVTLTGIETGNNTVGADQQRTLRAQVLAESVLRQMAGLFVQHSVDDGCQGLPAQGFPGLGYQRFVERMDKRQLQQALKVDIQALLQRRVAGVTKRPIVGQPVLEPGNIAALLQAQHQVRAQAVEQLLTVIPVVADMRFQPLRNLRQQSRL